MTFIAPVHILDPHASPPTLCGNGHLWSETTPDPRQATCPICVNSWRRRYTMERAGLIDYYAALLARADLSSDMRDAIEAAFFALLGEDDNAR
jgi:hypothetical protein